MAASAASSGTRLVGGRRPGGRPRFGARDQLAGIVDHDEVVDVRPLHTATALTVVLGTRPRPTEAQVTISALSMPERAGARIAAQALIGPAG